MALWIRKLFFKPVLWASNRFASRPEKDRIFKSLDELLANTKDPEGKKGLTIPFNTATDRFIIFSDQHKGRKNGADDFMSSEAAYSTALDYYFQKNYTLIALGDCEELWENKLSPVLKSYEAIFDQYRKFIAANRFYKTIGNHDLDWTNDPVTKLQIPKIFGREIAIYDAVLLQTSVENKTVEIFCTHGHQGDKASDGNWFSKFFISKIWAPLQSLLGINPNTPAYDAALKTTHNAFMYEWSAQRENTLLITGHTHQPLFESMTHLERLCRQLLFARQMGDAGMMSVLEKEIQMRKIEYSTISDDFLKLKPSYFNTGCCCFNDGDITGIEIEADCIRLIKWQSKKEAPQRVVLEEAVLKELMQAGKKDHVPQKTTEPPTNGTSIM